jgi:hypothetical protein
MKITCRQIVFSAMCFALIGVVCGHAQSVRNKPDLKTVLERAQKYVAAYEAQLGTLIGEEDYVQDAEWKGVRSLERRMSSDFLLTRIGPAWVGARNVLRVDGRPAEGKTTDFAKALNGSRESVAAQIRAVLEDNARYNIGDIGRTINVPTFPITILRPDVIRRFSFKKGPEVKIDSVTTWEIRFTEDAHPTLVRGFDGKDQYEHGRVWIDPETGEVLKTETVIDSKGAGHPFQATITVTYEANSKLGILVPATMQERYRNPSHSIDCLAKYSNFRRFEVDVKLSIPEAH